MNVGKSTMDQWVRQLKEERVGKSPKVLLMTVEQVDEAGIICFSNDPVSMADGIEHLCQLTSVELERLGNNGKNFYESKLSLNEGVRRFITIFNEVTDSK